MPVTVDRKFLLEANGQTLVLSGEEMQAAKTETVITITCAGPKCQARNQRPEPFSVTWTEEEVAKDPLKLPDAFFGMIKLGVDPTKPQELVFCGPQCVRDYLQYSYMPPQPPRIALENAKKEQAGQLAELNPHLIAGDSEKMSPELARTILKNEKVLTEVLNDPQIEEKLAEEGLRVDHEAVSEAFQDARSALTFPSAGEYEVEFHTTQTPPVALPPNSGSVLRVVEPQPALCQADGDPGE